MKINVKLGKTLALVSRRRGRDEPGFSVGKHPIPFGKETRYYIHLGGLSLEWFRPRKGLTQKRA